MPELKQFNVTVQGRAYKVITAANTGAALAAVIEDIKAGVVPDFDVNQPHDIQITNA